VLLRSLLFVAAIVASLATQATAEDKSILVASTMSTQDAALFGYLFPIFKEKTGIDVKVLAQGTTRALDIILDRRIITGPVHHIILDGLPCAILAVDD
jgi:tungstate transport system substrate-binding protein